MVLPVRDPGVSAAFYQRLGFRLGRSAAGMVTVSMNWFWLEFVVGEPIPSTAALVIRSGDLKPTIEEFLDADLGAHLVGELGPTGPGRIGIRMVDPDGYQLELFNS
jgi:catechol 2,3-dioxygenase-like lactoylglutathione lyase family enzyme